MREKRTFVVNTIMLLTVILLYYIVGAKSLFLYVLSLSLYKIFSASFNHISFKQVTTEKKERYGLFKLSILVLVLVSLCFLLISILVSNVMEIFLHIDNLLFIFLMMGLSIIGKPLIKLVNEYLLDNKYNAFSDIYDILDSLFLMIIAFLVFRVFKTSNGIGIAFLYLSKILPAILILGYIFIKEKSKLIIKNTKDNLFLYKQELKKIFTNDSYISVTQIIKNSYYYVSIIVLYRILSTVYGYSSIDIEKNITFIYFYAITIINYLIYLAKLINLRIPKELSVPGRIYGNFKIMLTIAIVFGFISPLTCKVIFNDDTMAIYLAMVNFMAIFMLLFDITYENIKKKEIVYISLLVGFIFKVILIIPLINAFYRMGYNLIYGDIISTVIAQFISIMINYIYLKRQEKEKHNYFDRVLDIVYENIILSIILVVFQFIIPMDTTSYFKSLGLIVIYVLISTAFIKLKNMKRG